MKKTLVLGLVAVSLFIASGCGATDEKSTTNSTTPSENTTTPTVTSPVSVPFADLNMDLMSANDTKTYKLYRFKEMEGSCVDQGFPTNMIYKSTNMVMTEDEKYADDWTSLDFAGNLRFKNVPLTGGPASCHLKTTKGLTTANLSCSVKEGETDKEICTGSVKLYAEK